MSDRAAGAAGVSFFFRKPGERRAMPVQANCPGCEYAYDVAAPLWGKFVGRPQCCLEFRAPVPSGGAYADRPEPPPVPAVPVPQAESRGPVDRPRPRRRDSVEVPDRRSPAMKLLVSIAAVLLLAVLSVVGYMVLLADRSPRAGSGFGPTTRLLGGPAFVEMDEKAIAMAELVAEADARQEQLEAGLGEIAEGLARDAMRRRERLEIEPEPDRGPVPRELVAVPVPPQDPPAPIDLPRSTASERELARPAKGADANVIAIDVDVRTRTGGDRPILAWDTAGKTFYCRQRAGTLQATKLDGIKQLRTLEIGFRSECLALSAEGLVVALPDREEVWVIASESLEVKHRIAVANVYRVVSSPDRSIAFAAGRASSLCVLDLKKGTVTFNYQEGGNEAHLYRGTCSPDGNYLFRMNNDVLERIRITGTNLSVEESGDHIARSSKAIQISPDSK